MRNLTDAPADEVAARVSIPRSLVRRIREDDLNFTSHTAFGVAGEEPNGATHRRFDR